MATNPHCRLCALKSENVIEVFETEGTALDLASKIKQCLQIMLTPEDVLPKAVCVGCCEKVLEYTEFFNNCSKSQECLLNLFVGKSIAKEINDIDFTLDSLNSEENKVVLDVTDSCFNDSLVGQFAAQLGVPEPEPHQTQPIEPPSGLDPESSNSLSELTSQQAQNNYSLSDVLQEDHSNDDLDDESSDEFDEQNNDSVGTLDKCVWKCATCNEEQSSLANLRAHYLNVHEELPVYKCVHCDKLYTRYRSYARHVKTHTSPKKYSCNICGKGFSQKTILQSHSAVHSDDRPHICDFCGKAFKQFSSLYLHSKCHVPNRVKPKLPCSICSKEFSTKHSLDTHLKIHTGEKNFICDICGKRFVAKGSLDYHILTHNEEKPHCCQVCGKSFKTGRLLSKHSNVHTGIKPHQCDVCGKQFRERGALKEHNRIHTGAMPYSCDFCGKLFRFKGILTVHRRLHTGERPYSCDICQREFTNWANCNKHMKRRHNGTASKREVITTTAPTPTTTAPSTAETVNLDIGSNVLYTEEALQHCESVYTNQQMALQQQDIYRDFNVNPQAQPQVQIATVSYYLPQHAVVHRN